MASDPRKFFVKQCGNTQAKKAGADAERKNFFNSIGKVGDIELLNSSALGGQVGQGLRGLAGISNSIRTGEPTSAIPQNGSDVLIATGISQASQAEAGSFNPGVLNRALSQGNAIADQVKGGQFSLSNIPNAFSDIQNLSTLVDGIFTNANDKDERVEICQASPYATDLIAYAPKFKFLFIVEFIYTDNFNGAMDGNKTAFVIKNTTRPNVTFEHEEVNMYNFWVKVPKRASYEPMTMRFYDDNKNGAMHFYESYLKAVSPIANMAFGSMSEAVSGVMEAQSMNFDAVGSENVNGGIKSFKTNGYTASLGPISTTTNDKNVIKRINMYHIYDYGKSMNTYRFLNPKILSLELDELDMADNGNGSELSFQFAYDAVNIATDVAVRPRAAGLKEKTTNGLYPFNPNFNNVAPEPGKQGQEGDPDEGGGFFSSVGAAIGTATGAVSGVLDFGTDLVSDAFQTTSDFAGSIFSDISSGASAAEASVKNSIKGDVPPGG